MSRDFYCGVSVTYIFNITDIFLFFLIYRETQINQKSRRPWSEVDKHLENREFQVKWCVPNV